MKSPAVNPEQALDRSSAAFKMRVSGMSYRQIAGELGVSIGTVHNWLKEWREEYQLANEEDAHTLRADESARLDSMLLALQPKIEAGEERAIDTALRIQARRAALWGIDAPTRAEVAGTVNIKISLE